jgi:hypothetical protein
MWRWIGIAVGGTVVPFGILALVFLLVTSHWPTWNELLGHGELFIPVSIMNVEVVWVWSHLTGWGRSVWYPLIVILGGTAAAAGAICFGITSALQRAPITQVRVTPHALRELSHNVAVFSLSGFGLALFLGTLGITMLMLVGEEVPSGE